jgi:hypothetical protein
MTIIPKEPWPDLTRVKKVRSAPGDTHPPGTLGEIVKYYGAAPLPGTGRKVHGYFIQWDGETEPFLCFNDGRLARLEEN